MRKRPAKTLESYRIRSGPMGSDRSYGLNGAFMVPHPGGTVLRVIASDGSDWKEAGLPKPAWEHVSVSLQGRCPTWGEMDYIKQLFWRDDETVLQFHVPVSEHVNCNEHCLHLWRPIGVDVPLPPRETLAP